MELMKKCLSTFTIAELAKILDKKIAKSLNDFEIQINKTNLIEILINNYGTNLLAKKEIRKNLVENNLNLLSEHLRKEDLEKINSFNWNNLTERVQLINLFGGEVLESHFSIEKRNLLSEVFTEGEELFPYQNWMRNKILKFLISEENSTLVQMPTGSGKTKTSMTSIIDFIRHRSPEDITVVWLAHTDELCEQAVESFEYLWKKIGIKKCNVWRMWGGLKENNYKGNNTNFIVTSFQSAYKWLTSHKDENFRSFLKIKNKCDLLLIDEAHMSIAPTYELVIDTLASNETKRIGLTATPGRGSMNSDDTESKKLANFFDNNLIKMNDNDGNQIKNPIKFLQDQKILSKFEFEELAGVNEQLNENEISKIEETLDVPSRVLKKIDTDKQRFLKIAQIVFEKAFIKKKQTLVFCPSKNNAILLSCFLNNYNASSNQLSASITSDMSRWERIEKINDFKSEKIKVLTNFGVLTTGFDVPKIEVVVIARPTFSIVLYSQMIGRGLRGSKVGGTNSVTIVNVKDNIQNLPDVYKSSTFFNYLFND